MIDDVAPTHPGIRRIVGASWTYLPEADAWIWQPASIARKYDPAQVAQLRAQGYVDIASDRRPGRLTALHGQLTDVISVPSSSGASEQLWAKSADVERVDRVPVALAFLVPSVAIDQQTGYRRVQVTEPLPPPQFGERALVRTTTDWLMRPLSVTGEEGLALWQRLGVALKQLASPAEWWEWTPEQDLCVDATNFDQLKRGLRARIQHESGAPKELARAQLKALEVMRQRAKAINTAADRRRDDPDTWFAAWGEIVDLAQQLAAMYWASESRARNVPSPSLADAALHAQSATLETDIEGEDDLLVPLASLDPERRAALAVLSRIETESSARSLTSSTYAEDRAVREATLSDKREWIEEGGIAWYSASNNLAVYFGDPRQPLPLAEARQRLLDISDQTALTARIIAGLWYQRRSSGYMLHNGSVGIKVEDVLHWRGVRKHAREAYPGAEKMVTDGYRSKLKEQVRQDLTLLNHLYIRGTHVIAARGKKREVNVDGQYWRVSSVTTKTLWRDDDIVGFFVSPGDWIHDYHDASNYYLSEIDRRIFELNPQNEQHELRLALYLVERWRGQAKKRAFGDPITMRDLLRQSVIQVNQKNLTNRFAPRIEAALEALRAKGVIGEYEQLTPVDRTKGRWGQEWLASRWRIVPPEWLLDAYAQVAPAAPSPLLPADSDKRGRARPDGDEGGGSGT